MPWANPVPQQCIARSVLAIVYLTCILLYLVLSSGTVDQTVITVLVQLGAGEAPILDL